MKTQRPLRSFVLGSGVECQVKPAEGEAKLGTFEGVAYTGAPMTPAGWGIPLIVDLEGVRVPSQHRPALHAHDHQQIVGNTTHVVVDDEGIKVKGNFSGEPEHTTKVVGPAGRGFKWQMSIGADPTQIEFLEAGKKATVNGREVMGPMDISRVTELNEVSFVALGADGDTSVSVAASKRRITVMFRAMLKAAKANGNIRAGKYSDGDIEKMSEDEAKAALKKCMADEEKPAEADDDEDKPRAEDDDEDEDEEDDAEADEEDDAEPKDDEEKPKAKGKGKAKASRRRAIAASKGSGLSAAKEFRRAIAAEERNAFAISALTKKYGVTSIHADGKEVPVMAHALDKDWTVEKVELELLKQSRASAAAGGPHLHMVSSPDLTEQVLECAVLQAARHQFRLEDDSFYHQPTPDGSGTMRRVDERVQRETQRELKARYTDQVQQSAHTMFKGRIAPKQLITAAFRRNGYVHELDLSGEHGIRSMLGRWDETERSIIRAEGASTISISNILANVLNKFALQGYLFVEQAWRRVCQIVPVNDFKPLKSINLLGEVMYKQLGPTGELENASLGDQAFSNLAAPFGRILTMPWTHIVNDDLGMLTGAPMKIGQGGGLALNDNIWNLWAQAASGSVIGDDGVAFWRTTSDSTNDGKKYNPNKRSGADSALASVGLTKAKAMFDNQIDPNGNPLGFDGTMPVLLFGPSNWRQATELMKFAQLIYGGGAAALQPNGNVWAGMMEPVMSRYVENAKYVNSTTAWWILFNPIALPVIQVAFLNGVDTPAVLQAGPDYQFDRLGISIRGTMPFGSNMQNFRGGVFSVGA